MLYNTLIVLIATYGSETWIIREEDRKVLYLFEMICLWKILGVTKMQKL